MCYAMCANVIIYLFIIMDKLLWSWKFNSIWFGDGEMVMVKHTERESGRELRNTNSNDSL